MTHLYGAFFVSDYGDMRERLLKEMTRTRKRSELVAIVIANGARPFSKQTILPLIAYWNNRSGDALTIFFPGYLGGNPDDEYGEVIDSNRAFVEKSFVETLEKIERDAGWSSYDGRTSVLICRGVLKQHPRTAERRAFLDFTDYIEFDLEAAIQAGVIDAVEPFFEALIRVAKTGTGESVQWKISDDVGGRALGNAIIDMACEYLPKGLKRVVKVADYFRIKHGKE
jgi:hypothetical protein